MLLVMVIYHLYREKYVEYDDDDDDDGDVGDDDREKYVEDDETFCQARLLTGLLLPLMSLNFARVTTFFVIFVYF